MRRNTADSSGNLVVLVDTVRNSGSLPHSINGVRHSVVIRSCYIEYIHTTDKNMAIKKNGTLHVSLTVKLFSLRADMLKEIDATPPIQSSAETSGAQAAYRGRHPTSFSASSSSWWFPQQLLQSELS